MRSDVVMRSSAARFEADRLRQHGRDVLRATQNGVGRAKVLAWRNAVILGVLLPFSSAAADGEIRSVRIGSHGGYDRLVFELGASPVDVYEAGGSSSQIEFTAAPPVLSRGTEQNLSALGVTIAATMRGTSVAVARDGRPWVAFRLRSSAPGSDQNDRIVLDLGRGSTEPRVPQGAEALPVRSARAATSPESAESPSPALPSPSLPGASLPGASLPVAPVPGAPLPQVESAQEAARVPQVPVAAVLEESVWVRVSSVDFEGITGAAPTRDELFALEIDASVAPGGDLVAQRDGLPAQKFLLSELAVGPRANARVGGSLLQQIVERIAAVYASQQKYGTRVDIQKTDLQRLVDDRGGKLTIRIMESTDSRK
jgi:hypothetical protein